MMAADGVIFICFLRQEQNSFVSVEPSAEAAIAEGV